MNTETQPATQLQPETLQSNIDYAALGAAKLDTFFADPKYAKKYLGSEGWLCPTGVEELRKQWNAYSMCFTLMKMSCEELPKTKEVVEMLNAKLVGSGCSFSLRQGEGKIYFGLFAKNFFWFGGASKG